LSIVAAQIPTTNVSSVDLRLVPAGDSAAFFNSGFRFAAEISSSFECAPPHHGPSGQGGDTNDSRLR